MLISRFTCCCCSLMKNTNTVLTAYPPLPSLASIAAHILPAPSGFDLQLKHAACNRVPLGQACARVCVLLLAREECRVLLLAPGADVLVRGVEHRRRRCHALPCHPPPVRAQPSTHFALVSRFVSFFVKKKRKT